MFKGRDDVSTEVKLIDLPEGDDVDPFNVTTANLRDNIQSLMYRYNLQLLRKITTLYKAFVQVTRCDNNRELSAIKAFPALERLEALHFSDKLKL